MSARTHPPETDLIAPLPAPGEQWDPHTIHTHYLPFCVPEAGIGLFNYIRYHPAFPLGQGGVLVYQGSDNLVASDMLFQDYEMTMAWPKIEGTKFTTANGLSFDFVEPGKRVLLRYQSADDECSFDVEATAVSPLAVRGHLMPGEELHVGQQPGGSEQFMHYVGELVVRGERYAVDCHYIRDRTWGQVRKESRTANRHPPICWTPVYFGADFTFNQIGIEAPDSNPAWAGAYELPDDAPLFHFAWVTRDGEVRNLTRVHRAVTEAHPLLSAPLKMEIEAEDEAGDIYRLKGESIAFSPIPTWPNLIAYESLYRWTDEHGRVGYGPAQTAWSERIQHAYKAHRLALSGQAQ